MNWDLVWLVFLAVAGIGFGVLEWQGFRDDRDGKKNYGTLSATLRRWLGVDPPAGRRWLLSGVFLAALAVFGVHILTPWL